jgi:Asp-tRNA(Asn)/Glu-tRNA(Gln) amidotransferase A subunit family amidase
VAPNDASEDLRIRAGKAAGRHRECRKQDTGSDMTGQPTLTLPGGFSTDGLPIAFQMVAADLGEATLIRAGIAFQRATDWHRRHPAL